jgi:AcrR family transcriptional regulator
VAEEVTRTPETAERQRPATRPNLGGSGDGLLWLTVDEIVGRAIELLDREGVQALSMRRLGDALGVSAPALYRHIQNKARLTTLVLRRVMADFAYEPDRSAGWDEEVGRLMIAIREHVLRYPWVTELAQGEHVLGLHVLGDTVHELLRSAGLSESDIFLHRRLLIWSVWGFVTTEVELATRSTHVPVPDATGLQSRRRYRVTLAGDGDGVLHRLPEPYDVVDLDELFEANVQHFISGVQTFAARATVREGTAG